MLLAETAQTVQVTGSHLDWPTAVVMCAACAAVAAIFWAIAWSSKNV